MDTSGTNSDPSVFERAEQRLSQAAANTMSALDRVSEDAKRDLFKRAYERDEWQVRGLENALSPLRQDIETWCAELQAWIDQMERLIHHPDTVEWEQMMSHLRAAKHAHAQAAACAAEATAKGNDDEAARWAEESQRRYRRAEEIYRAM